MSRRKKAGGKRQGPSLKAISAEHLGMMKVGPSFVAGSMFAIYPQAEWFLITPYKESFVNIQAVNSFIDATCSSIKNCDVNIPIVIASDKSLRGVVLVSRGAAKEAVLAGRSGLLGVAGVVFRAVESLTVITDMVSYQRERLTESSRRPQNIHSCALVFSTAVPLSALHWGTRESPQALAHMLLRPPAIP